MTRAEQTEILQRKFSKYSKIQAAMINNPEYGVELSMEAKQYLTIEVTNMGDKKADQKERILAWFRTNETLDRIQAVNYLGIFELSARICELKKLGYKFETEYLDKTNQYGKFRCAKYTLIKA